MRSRIYQLIV